MSAAPPVDPAIGLGQIQAADPSFDVEVFKHQALDTFESVKNAVSGQDLSPVADLLSENVYDDLRLDVMGLQDRGAPLDGDGLTPTLVVVEAANQGPEGDSITLRIQAVATQSLGLADRDYTAPGGLGQLTEYWTFTRPPTAAGDAARRNECPTCGAPIDIDTGRVCRFCKTLLPNRQVQTGWVVAAIQPAQENF